MPDNLVPRRNSSRSSAISPADEYRRLETLTKIPLEDRATDPGQLQKVEGTMDRGQLVVADLQAAGLPDPCQGPFHHPADLAQAAPMRRPWPRQVVLDAPLLEPFPVPLGPVRPVPIQGLRLPPRAPTPAVDRRDVVHQVHGFERLVAVGRSDPHGQWRALAIDQQVPFGAFFPAIRGVFAGQDP